MENAVARNQRYLTSITTKRLGGIEKGVRKFLAVFQFHVLFELIPALAIALSTTRQDAAHLDTTRAYLGQTLANPRQLHNEGKYHVK